MTFQKRPAQFSSTSSILLQVLASMASIRFIQKMAVALGAASVPSFLGHCESMKSDPLDEWERKKLECPKCVVYIKSPCRYEFKNAGKCSERVHETNGNVEACMADLIPFLACEKKHIEYFQSLESNQKKA
jgi:hypothetical protein